VLASIGYGSADDDASPERLERSISLYLKAQSIVLRRQYAPWLLYLVVGQVVTINAFLLVIGLGWVKITDGLFKIFSISVFVEVVALAMVVTRSLFPSRRGLVEELTEALKGRHAEEDA
ncbi:MAG: hypothetical protein QOI11_1163, partial [Candidatus Eremiobacteraeota bacterium]|nr:hypothetical protein [Candidatus Eremiobacteraeota bacterium]